MRRPIKLKMPATPSEPPVCVAGAPERLTLSQPGTVPTVAVGDRVAAGQCVARGEHADVHAPMAGTIEEADKGRIVVAPDGAWPPTAARSELPPTADYPEFLARLGLLGMGGGMFPAMLKARAARDVHTLIVNGVECEPGTAIDQAVLLHEPDLVRRGAEASAAAVGAEQIVLAVHRDRAFERQVRELYGWTVVGMPNVYPAGAETLIVKRLVGHLPAPGVLPFQLGFLVQNVISLRAVGRGVVDGVGVIERPLSVVDVRRGTCRNVVVPVGLAVGDLLTAVDGAPDAAEGLIAGGLMMGQAVSAASPITKGTTSVFRVPREWLEWRERPCIRCGACIDACPLGLHPIGMLDRISRHDDNCNCDDVALAAQLQTCFLCGACTAVCPARINLAGTFRKEKACLKEYQQAARRT